MNQWDTLKTTVAQFAANDVTDEQKTKLAELTETFQETAASIWDTTPKGWQRNQALTKLLESKWTAVQAVTHATTG